MQIKKLKFILSSFNRSSELFFPKVGDYTEVKVTDKEPFSQINNMMPNQDIVSYLFDASSFVPPNEKLKIIFDDEVDKDKLNQVYFSYFHSLSLITLKKLKRNRITQIIFLISGAIILALSFLLDSHLDRTLVEILSIIGSFSVWEAADITIFERSEMKKELGKIYRIVNAEWVQEDIS